MSQAVREATKAGWTGVYVFLGLMVAFGALLILFCVPDLILPLRLPG